MKIDITPTWTGMLPYIMLILSDSTSAADRAYAKTELQKMARLADLYVQSQDGK